ncbi:MAG: hypothetical protein M3R00_03585 [Pseudomonadota bacterium]|nr:hypothetical protein [Pseudomonadota bacterium]
MQVRIQEVCNSFGYKPQTIEVSRAQTKLLKLDLSTLIPAVLPATVTLRTPDGAAAVDGSFVTSSLLGTVPGYADFNPRDGIGLETLYGPLSISDWHAINVIYNLAFTINTTLK